MYLKSTFDSSIVFLVQGQHILQLASLENLLDESFVNMLAELLVNILAELLVRMLAKTLVKCWLKHWRTCCRTHWWMCWPDHLRTCLLSHWWKMAARMRCHYQEESLIHLILITPLSHYQRDSLIQLTLITAFYLCLTQKSPGDLYQGWIPNLTHHKVHFKSGRFMFQFDCNLSEYSKSWLGVENSKHYR